MSEWNLYLAAKLARDLTVEEHRLADTLARNLLGFRRREDRLGERLLREQARLHGRSFERARDGLVEKGLLHFEPGRPGPGGRGKYRLLIDPETPAVERATPESAKTPAPQRAIGAEMPAETPAVERARIKEGNYLKLGLDGEAGPIAVERDPARPRETDPTFTKPDLTPEQEAQADLFWEETAEQMRKPPWA